MDVKAFGAELFSALARADFIERVALQVEGFVVSGRAFLPEQMFLDIYFNEVTQTIAFALIKERARVCMGNRQRQYKGLASSSGQGTG